MEKLTAKHKMIILAIIGFGVIGAVGDSASESVKGMILTVWIAGMVYLYLQLKKEKQIRIETDPEYAQMIEEKEREKEEKKAKQNALIQEIRAQKQAQKMAKKNPGQLTCPKCGSTQLHAGKKPLSLKRAVAGTLLLNPVGGVIGAVTSKKLIITCMNCGHHWKAGKRK